MFIKLLYIILLLIITAEVKADAFVSEKDLKPFTDKVMEIISKGELKKAFNTLKPYLTISDAEFQAAVQNSETQRIQLAEKFGSPMDYEFIGQKKSATLCSGFYILKNWKSRHLSGHSTFMNQKPDG